MMDQLIGIFLYGHLRPKLNNRETDLLWRRVHDYVSYEHVSLQMHEYDSISQYVIWKYQNDYLDVVYDIWNYVYVN